MNCKFFSFSYNLISLLIISYSFFISKSEAKIFVYKTNDTFNDRLAAFGPQLSSNDGSVEGVLIPVEMLEFKINSEFIINLSSASPQSGCFSYIPPSSLENKTWIALVERGGCSFVDKVRNMQRIGAKAVVVGDNEKGNGLITMYSNEDTSDISIPSVFIRQWTYRELQFLTRPTSFSRFNTLQLREQAKTQFLLVKIMKSDEFQWPLLDIIIVTVIAPIVILVFLYSLWRFRRRNFIPNFTNYQSQQDDGVLSSEDLEKLEIIVYHSKNTSEQENLAAVDSCCWDTCAVCLDLFEDGDELRILPLCKHLFHVKCIDPWLLSRRSFCPLCKSSVRLREEDDDGENDNDETQPLLQESPILPQRNSSRLLTIAIPSSPSPVNTNVAAEDDDDHLSIARGLRQQSMVFNENQLQQQGIVSRSVPSNYNPSIMRLFGSVGNNNSHLARSFSSYHNNNNNSSRR